MKKETLTSRQRVQRAIEHKPLDRMPIDFGVHFSTGISAFAYYNLREYLGLSTDNIEMIDMIQCLARVDDDILERFHVDTMLLNPPWPQSKDWHVRDKYHFRIPAAADMTLMKDGSWQVIHNGATLRMAPGGYYFHGGWPDYYDLDEDAYFDLFARRAEIIHKETDKFTMMMGFASYFGGLEFACDMLTDPQEAYESNQRLFEQQLARARKTIDRLGGYIDAVEINGDLGSQDGLLCTPQSFVDICAPFLSKICDFFHQNSDIKLFMHSCGSIVDLLPTIIDCGIDVINPVQISARGMDPRLLKSKYGEKIAFWGGGVDTQAVLPFKSADKVAEQARELISIFKPGSGFIFNQVHNVMGDVPPENVVRLYDTAYENSFYDETSR